MTIPEHFAIAQTSLQKTSFDDAHKNPMSKSQLVVYDFDAIKGWFQDTWEKETGREIHLRSNDALYVDVNGQPYFIEFKNGKLKKRSNTRTELHLKMYESFLRSISNPCAFNLSQISGLLNPSSAFQRNAFLNNSPFQFTFK